ncbi:MAG: hypothetical protein FWH55_10935 [Oscillospiraceae bacterium]|nr:hypothetical protein [Oscillospiraceae bacterium]
MGPKIERGVNHPIVLLYSLIATTAGLITDIFSWRPQKTLGVIQNKDNFVKIPEEAAKCFRFELSNVRILDFFRLLPFSFYSYLFSTVVIIFFLVIYNCYHLNPLEKEIRHRKVRIRHYKLVPGRLYLIILLTLGWLGAFAGICWEANNTYAWSPLHIIAEVAIMIYFMLYLCVIVGEYSTLWNMIHFSLRRKRRMHENVG